MCGDILGLGSSAATTKAVKMKPVVPAAPAPERKQDSGAIVAIGDNDSSFSDERRRRAGRTVQRGGSSLGSLGGANVI